MQRCGVEGTTTCQPLGISWTTVAIASGFVAVYLLLAVTTAAHRALPAVARRPSTTRHEQRMVAIAEQMAIASGFDVPGCWCSTTRR